MYSTDNYIPPVLHLRHVLMEKAASLILYFTDLHWLESQVCGRWSRCFWVSGSCFRQRYVKTHMHVSLSVCVTLVDVSTLSLSHWITPKLWTNERCVWLYDYIYRKEACVTDTVSVQGRRAADFKTGCYFSCVSVTHTMFAHIIFYWWWF